MVRMTFFQYFPVARNGFLHNHRDGFFFGIVDYNFVSALKTVDMKVISIESLEIGLLFIRCQIE